MRLQCIRNLLRHRMTSINITAVLAIQMVFSVSPTASAQESDVARSVNSFGIELYGELVKASEGNVFFSPFSVSTALAMTWAGARGETADEMATVLQFTGEPAKTHESFRASMDWLNESEAGNPVNEIAISNALWTDWRYPLLKEFKKTVESGYLATADIVSFTPSELETTREHINSRIAKDTRGRIPELLVPGDLDPATMIVLTNAIYFKGFWLTQFDPANTREEPFFLTGDDSVTVNMMRVTLDGLQYRYFSGDGFQMLDLPYADGDFAITIVLPDQRDGLLRLETALPDSLGHWLEKLEEPHGQLALAMPKLELRYRSYLKPMLQALGMRLAFTQAADFRNMFVRDNAWIDKVIHEASIAVDEKGSEAAAATAVVMRKGPRPMEFRADHPFLFLIRDRKTGVILFLGRVMNPKG